MRFGCGDRWFYRGMLTVMTLTRLCFIYFRFAGPISRMANGIWPTCWPERKRIFPPPSGKMILYVSFFNKAHEGSSSPVAYLKGSRLERSTES